MYPKSILETIQKSKSGKVLNTASLQCGKDKVALSQYMESHSPPEFSVMACGIIINPKLPWLGASPDGLLIENGKVFGGIEIKCPYSKREKSVAEACKEKQFFMECGPHGPKLKLHHAYFYQCQGTMYIVGLSWMDSVVFTEKDLFVERIYCNSKL